MATFTDKTVQVVTLDGEEYQLVETYADTPIVTQDDTPFFFFITDNDDVSDGFWSVTDARGHAGEYRASVLEVGSDGEDFTRVSFGAKGGRLRMKADVIRVSSKQAEEGVYAYPITADGTRLPELVRSSDLHIMPADLLTAGQVSAAEAALLRMENAEAELAAAEADLANMGAQLESHPDAVYVPRAELITEAVRVELTDELTPMQT